MNEDKGNAQDALRESEERYRLLAENSLLGIGISCGNYVIFANPALLRMFGYVDLKAFAKIPLLDHVAPASRELIIARMQKVARGETVPMEFEYDIVRKDGRTRTLLATSSHYGHDGQTYTQTTFQDITERKRTGEELRESCSVLEATVESTADGILVVDRHGKITRFNQRFAALWRIPENILRQSVDQLRSTMKAAINSLSSAIEMRDPYTSGHQEQVTKLAAAIARAMGLSEDEIEATQVAGIVHDIGKLSIPAEILSKPARLTEIEYSLVKTHPEVGYTILSKIDFPWPIAKIVRQHHERIDGTGYPNRLPGKDLLIEAKILGVADVVEAMSSHRPYRPSLGVEEALKEISEKSGTLYDPDVVKACLKLFAEKKFKF